MKSENLYYDYYKSTCAQLSRLTSYRNKLVIALFFIIVLVSLPELLNEIIVLYTHVEPQDMDSSNKVDTVYIDLLLYIAFLMAYMHYGSVNIQCRRLADHLTEVEGELSATGRYVLDRESGQKDDSYNRYMRINNLIFNWFTPIFSAVYFLYRTLSHSYLNYSFGIESRYLLFAIALAIAAISFMNVFIYRRRKVITGTTDLARLTQRPVLGTLSYMPVVGRIRIQEYDGSFLHRNLLENQFNEIIHNLLSRKRSTDRIFAIVSYNRGDGKSFIAYCLAASLSFKGKKVLLWNLNLRRGDPRFWDMNARRLEGCRLLLCDAETKVEDYIGSSTAYPNMDILPVGCIPPYPVKMLCSPNLKVVAETLKKRYDYIVIDTASMVVADTNYLSSIIDMSVFVCRAGYTPYTVIDKIRNSSFPNPAIILNGVVSKTNLE